MKRGIHLLMSFFFLNQQLGFEPANNSPKKGHATHIAVLVSGSSHPGVHVFNVTGGPDDQGRPGVNDGLAATGARHHITVDGDTGTAPTECQSSRRSTPTTFLLFMNVGFSRYLSIWICQYVAEVRGTQVMAPV